MTGGLSVPPPLARATPVLIQHLCLDRPSTVQDLTGLYEFESLPPLGSYDPDRGFVPDLPSLLMFDEYVLDGEAYERIRNPGHRHWLREWSELLEVLESEGAIAVEDVQAAASTHSYRRGWMLRRALQEPAWSVFSNEDGALEVSGEVLMIHQLREEGLSISAIARRVGLDRTVRRLSQPLIASTPLAHGGTPSSNRDFRSKSKILASKFDLCRN